MSLRGTIKRQVWQVKTLGWNEFLKIKAPQLENRFLRHPIFAVVIWVLLFPLLLIRNVTRNNGLRTLPELHKRLRQAFDTSVGVEIGDSEIKKLVDRARRLSDSGDHEAGFRELREGKGRYPDSFDISNAFSNELFFRGRYSETVSEYRRGVEIQDKEAEARGLTGLGIRILNRSWSGPMGHIALLDQVAKARELGWLTEESRVVIANQRATANLTYLRYWEKYFPILFMEDSGSEELQKTLWPIFEFPQMFRFRDGPVDYWSAFTAIDEEWNRQSRAPLLALKDSDRARSEPIFRAWGIPEGSWFVCFHIREGSHRRRGSENSDPLSYLSAMEEVVRQGGIAIRMGNPAMIPLPKIEGIIDYAHAEQRTDWLDVALWAQCKFFVGTNSGPLCVPASFGVPTLSTNVPHIGLVPSLRNSMFIPKLCTSDDGKELVPLSRLLELPVAWTGAKQSEEVKVRLIDNSSDDLRLAVIEMLEALQTSAGSFIRNADQLIFDQIRRDAGGIGSMPIAHSFLTVHHELLR